MMLDQVHFMDNTVIHTGHYFMEKTGKKVSEIRSVRATYGHIEDLVHIVENWMKQEIKVQ